MATINLEARLAWNTDERAPAHQRRGPAIVTYGWAADDRRIGWQYRFLF